MNIYALHLAKLNQQQKVTAACHIFNTRGKIILQNGVEINDDAAVILLENTLPKSLDGFIQIDAPLEAQQLAELLKKYLQLEPSYCELYEQQDIDIDIDTCCEAVCQYDILRQRLTVLYALFPEYLDQAMFCAWLIITLQKNEDYDKKTMTSGFIAALCQNIGYLDISPEILNKNIELNQDDKKTVQTHPSLAQKILSQIPGFPKDVIRAVQEHHESLDGSGYPLRKVGRQLCKLGLSLNFIGTVHAIYQRHFKPRKRTLRDTVPIIEMNILMRHDNAVKILISFLEKGTKTNTCSVPNKYISELVQQMKKQHDDIVLFIKITQDFLSEVGVRHENARLHAIQNIALHIASAVGQADIVNEAYIRWLDQVVSKNLKHAYRELEDVFLMMQEIRYHMQRFQHQISLMQQTNFDLKLKAPIATVINKLAVLPSYDKRLYVPDIMIEND